MKKIICLIFAVSLLLMTSACNNNPEEAGLDVAELGEYAIIYPQSYHTFEVRDGEIYDYRMQDVYDLRDAITAVTGKEPAIVSDAEAIDAYTKKIIIASSDADHALKEKTETLKNGFDYIIALDGENVVLGGNNYYADMRAVYSFINGWLGYDDREKKTVSEPKKIKEYYEYNYEDPPLKIVAACFSGHFPTYEAAKTVADANFNFVIIPENPADCSRYELMDQLRWFSRFGIRVILSWYSNKLTPLYFDCPAVYGHFHLDEPKVNDVPYLEEIDAKIRNYVSEVEGTGWVPMMNYAGLEDRMVFFTENSHFFDCCPMVCLDLYWGTGGTFSPDWYNEYNTKVLHQWEHANELCSKTGRELWSFIQAYQLDRKDYKGDSLNTSKMFRWQSNTVLSFGSKAILYWNYNNFDPVPGEYVLDADYNPTRHWEYVRRNNAELLKLADLMDGYEYKGTYVNNFYGTVANRYWAELSNEYHGADDILNVKYSVIGDNPVLVGCFEKANGKAFLITNLSDVDQLDYDDSLMDMIVLEINGTPAFYIDGEKLQESDYSVDGNKYMVSFENGHSVFVTVE